MTNWLRSPPICRLQAGDPGKPCVIQSWVWGPVKQRRCDVVTQAVRQEKKKWIPPSFTFCCIQVVHGLDDAHTHWGGQSAESTDWNANPFTLTDTSRNKVLMWAPCGQSRWHIKSPVTVSLPFAGQVDPWSRGKNHLLGLVAWLILSPWGPRNIFWALRIIPSSSLI